MSPTAILVPAGSRPPCTHAEVFRRAGVRIAEAYSGTDVKRLMAIQRPDAVLMDAGITPAASADVWRALDQSTPAAHVVMFGRCGNEAVRAHARQRGALWLEPRSEEDLVAALKDLMSRYQEARRKTERIHSEMTANVRELQIRIRHTQLLDTQQRERAAILVADDEEYVRRFLTAALERAGYIVLEASDGSEAVRVLWNYGGAVRLVILDWVMPGLGGVEVVRTLRKVSSESRLLICTGSPESVVRASLRDEKVEGILEKPFLAMDLLEEVARQLHP